MTTTPPDTSNPTDDPQRQKLLLEIEQLRRPLWKSPTIVVAFIALSGSLLGNVVQFVNGSVAARQSEERLGIERSKWAAERQNYSDELTRLAAQDKVEQGRREALQTELTYLNDQIQTWDGAIFKSKTSLMVFQDMPDHAAPYEVALKTQEEQRATLVERRDKVEKLISSCK